jgi:carbamoyl-phosphate synthase/aspartate carbamoyltransferase
MLAANFRIPAKGSHVLVSIATGRFRDMLLESVQMLASMGYKLCGTPGTAEFYRERFVL